MAPRPNRWMVVLRRGTATPGAVEATRSPGGSVLRVTSWGDLMGCIPMGCSLFCQAQVGQVGVEMETSGSTICSTALDRPPLGKVISCDQNSKVWSRVSLGQRVPEFQVKHGDWGGLILGKVRTLPADHLGQNNHRYPWRLDWELPNLDGFHRMTLLRLRHQSSKIGIHRNWKKKH